MSGRVPTEVKKTKIITGDVIHRAAVLEKIAHHHITAAVHGKTAERSYRFVLFLPGPFPQNLRHAQIRSQQCGLECRSVLDGSIESESSEKSSISFL